MTFEEFFVKKRIDLARLKQAKPDLYEEFREHYRLMGEKSFDHTKKYWFNRLRKDFLLIEPKEPKSPEIVKAPAPITTPSTTGETSVAPASAAAPSKPAGSRLRFKAAGKDAPPTPPAAGDTSNPEENSSGTASSSTESSGPIERLPVTKPSGFKPRFKSGVDRQTSPEIPASLPSTPDQPSGQNDPATDAGVTDGTSTKDHPPTVSKPVGFKPRFKSGVTKAIDPKTPSDTPPAEVPPGRQKLIGGAVASTEENIGQQHARTEEAGITASQPDEPANTPPARKPIGFKPRFKPGDSPSAEATDPAAAENTTQNFDTDTPDLTSAADLPDTENQSARKPIGFKPRFKPSGNKPADGDTDD